MRFSAKSAPSSDARRARAARVVGLGLALLSLALAFASTRGFAPRAHAQPGAAPSVDALLHAFAAMPGLYARFHEEKQIALLSLPVESDGEIYFAPPDRLMRKVTSPIPSRALLEGDRVTLVSPGERRVLDLGTSPVVRGFVGAFRDVLAGDRAALERSYHLDFSTEGEEFTLTLRPKRPALARFLRELRLQGRAHSLTRLHMLETSGDVTDTTFTDVDPARHYSSDDLARLFTVGTVLSN
ncbi:MAG: outer membrane lipoprotein carrier protein LolA [Deltaproteobacteria bacterium]|nr:outer membrane lipoprotein carrier protein LolA [Deltaproteobacteria bacterium]